MKLFSVPPITILIFFFEWCGVALEIILLKKKVFILFWNHNAQTMEKISLHYSKIKTNKEKKEK